MKQAKAKQEYRPGETTPESGVYVVIHHGHRAEHDVTLFRDETFPPCTRCGDAVRFRLAGIAIPIQEDKDFKR